MEKSKIKSQNLVKYQIQKINNSIRNSPVKSLPIIGSRNLNTNSKLSQRFDTIKKDDKSRSMNNLVQNGVNIVNSLPNSKSRVSKQLKINNEKFPRLHFKIIKDQK